MNEVILNNQPVVEQQSTSTTTTTIPEVKKQRGCWFWGCMTMLAFLLITIIIFVIGAWYMFNKAGNFAIEWSTDTPIALPATTYTGTEIESGPLYERWTVLEDVIEKGGTGTYTIDQEMIDAVLVREEIDEYVSLELLDNTVKVYTSLPLEGLELELDKLDDRYFNGVLVGDFSYKNGKISAIIQDVDFSGKDLPTWLSDELVGKNIGPHLYQEEEFVERIQRFDSLTVSGGLIVVEMKE